MDEIIGRHEHVARMHKALKSDKAEMVALVGRRRVGKTYLIRKVYDHVMDFELTGIQYATKGEQLHNFVIAMTQYFPGYPISTRPSSWLDAFHELSQALEQYDRGRKQVVFIDELPWLGSKRSGFIKGLSHFWNSWASKRNIVVVICGSAASWMIDKVINNKGGLHNRVTMLLQLDPFTLAETEAYCKYRNIKLNRYQILQIYMVMGGIPMYLDQLQPGLSAVQNIQEVCFSRLGYLRQEFDRLFASLFDNYQNHIEIVRALATKRRGMTRQEIIAASSFSNGGMLSSILEELFLSGFIGIYSAYDKKTKQRLYRLTDAYSLFYLTYLDKLGPNTNTDFTKLSDLPSWKSWSGYTFENICMAHIDHMREAMGISGIATSTSTFIAKPKDGFTGAQIDLLIDRNDQSINICEMKYSTTDYELTKTEAAKIENRKKVFRYHTKTKKHLFTTLVTTHGVIDNAHRLNHVDGEVVLDDLFVDLDQKLK